MSQRVAVVGAGMVGLSTAWFLQEHGFHVTVYERDHVAAGSSWGNAGWLTPALTAPLPEPAVLALRGPRRRPSLVAGLPARCGPTPACCGSSPGSPGTAPLAGGASGCVPTRP